jgi:hypothetical protein
VTVGFSFDDELDDMHRNLVREAPMKRPEDMRWPSYNSFALDTATTASCAIQIDGVRLPLGHWA